MPRPALPALLFWVASGVSVAVVVAAAMDIWLGRSDAAGRGMAGAYAVFILPFPLIGLAVFLLGRSTRMRIAAAVVAALPLLAVLALTGMKRVADRGQERSRSARAIFREPGPRAMAEAIEAGWMERIRFLLSDGIDVNARGDKGETLLGFALRRRQVDAALELARRGADPLKGPPGEANALRLAAQDPAFVEVLRALLKPGANPDVAIDDDIGRPTPLVFLAMDTNALPNIRAVVEAGARLDVRDTNGRTPLARAILWRMWEEALLMVERGAPVAPGQDGLANLETTLADVRPPDAGTPEDRAFSRLLARLAEKGIVPAPDR